MIYEKYYIKIECFIWKNMEFHISVGGGGIILKEFLWIIFYAQSTNFWWLLAKKQGIQNLIIIVAFEIKQYLFMITLTTI